MHELTDVEWGTMFFAAVDGEPVLLGLDTSAASMLHVARMFVEQHAPPGSTFYAWRFKPPPGVDIDRFWQHLRSKGAWIPVLAAVSNCSFHNECALI